MTGASPMLGFCARCNGDGHTAATCRVTIQHCTRCDARCVTDWRDDRGRTVCFGCQLRDAAAHERADTR